MKILIPLLFITLLSACNLSPSKKFISEKELNDSTSAINVDDLISLKKGKTYRFYIPIAFTPALNGSRIDTLLSTNYLSLNNGNYEAKFYLDSDGNELLAINNVFTTENCVGYVCYILKQNKDSIPTDQFETIFPKLSVHSFYEFGDKHLNQFEGDEETVFSGYQLDLSRADSLGVQFMFCNQKNSVNTDFLNSNGKIIYKNFIEL